MYKTVELTDIDGDIFKADVQEVLDELEEDDIVDYAIDKCNLINKDEVEKYLHLVDEYDLTQELHDRSFNFAEEVDIDDCIEKIEMRGYVVLDEMEIESSKDLDYVDSVNLDEIIDMFTNASWSERQEIYLRVKNGNL